MTTTTFDHRDPMPALTNRTIADARRELHQKYPDLVIAVHGDDAATVHSQVPLAGQPILGRRQVALSDLEWRQEVDVPDLVDIDPPTVANVYVVCGARDLDVLIADGEQVRRPGDGDWNRCVAGYDDAPGRLPRGAAVHLVVTDTVLSTMPNLVGRTIALARQVLQRRFPGRRLEVRGADDQIVKSQFPPAFREVGPAMPLSIDVGVMLTVPPLAGMPVSLANMECTNSGLSLAICNNDSQPLATCESPPPATVQAWMVSHHHTSTQPYSPIPPGGTVGVILVPPLKTLDKFSLALGIVVGITLAVLIFYLF